MKLLKQILTGKSAISRYFVYSVIVTLVDTLIVWTLTRFSSIQIVTANTIGVVTGFILQYLLSSKSVFDTEYGSAGFIIYLGTFLLGLAAANWLTYVSYEHIFVGFAEDLRILLSKGVSIAIPFFLLYYLRKYLFLLLNKRRQ